MNDFLLTVLSTAGNLESLIDSKPTERGNVLSRFIGLEIKEKENLFNENIDNRKNLKQLEVELVKNNKFRDGLISKKFVDIDIEIQKVNPRLVNESLEENNLNLENLNSKLKAYGDKEIPEEVDLEFLDLKTKDRDGTLHKKIQNTTNLKSLNKTLKNLIESEICPTCKQL